VLIAEIRSFEVVGLISWDLPSCGAIVDLILWLLRMTLAGLLLLQLLLLIVVVHLRPLDILFLELMLLVDGGVSPGVETLTFLVVVVGEENAGVVGRVHGLFLVVELGLLDVLDFGLLTLCSVGVRGLPLLDVVAGVETCFIG
jgi:hypothetical protein